MDESKINDKLDKINDKMDKLIENDAERKVELVEIKKGYEYHVYRTDLAEEAIRMNKNATEKGFEKVQEQLEPLKTFKDYLTGGGKLFIFLLSLTGVILGILKFFRH